MKKINTNSRYSYTTLFDAMTDTQKLICETVGKDEYGHDVILDGMTPKINGKIKHVYPCLRYIDLEAWALQSKHYVRRK